MTLIWDDKYEYITSKSPANPARAGGCLAIPSLYLSRSGERTAQSQPPGSTVTLPSTSPSSWVCTLESRRAGEGEQIDA